MPIKAEIDDFLGQRSLAVVGVSRSGKGFAFDIFKQLQARGYRAFPVNPHAENIAGERCYPNLTALPESVGGALVIIPKAQSDTVVRDAAKAGIRRVWLQQGCGSESAIRFCSENGIAVVHGHCILMFLEPVSFFHRLHRGLLGLFGKLPR